MVFWHGPREPFPFARARGCWGADSLQARLPFLDNNPSRIAHAAKMALAPDEPMTHIDSMTAIAEIESAIERLSPAEVKELAAWLDEYQQIINASAEIFSMYDQEEKAGS
jgi:tRNA isopentenyl-2-thiomethyl-A-37 hydroxylase MiaE